MRWGHMLDFLLQGCWGDTTYRIVCSLSVFLALYGIRLVIEFEFPCNKVNHFDEVIYVPVSTSSFFRKLNF